MLYLANRPERCPIVRDDAACELLRFTWRISLGALPNARF